MSIQSVETIRLIHTQLKILHLTPRCACKKPKPIHNNNHERVDVTYDIGKGEFVVKKLDSGITRRYGMDRIYFVVVSEGGKPRIIDSKEIREARVIFLTRTENYIKPLSLRGTYANETN